MDWILFWPESPMLSLAVLWIVTVVLFWAARSAMLDVFERLGAGAREGLGALADGFAQAAENLRLRSRQALLAAGTLDLHRKLDREFHGIDKGFADKLEQYGKLHRKLDELLQKLDDDYRACGDSPPRRPGLERGRPGHRADPEPERPERAQGARRHSQVVAGGREEGPRGVPRRHRQAPRDARQDDGHVEGGPRPAREDAGLGLRGDGEHASHRRLRRRVRCDPRR